MSAYSALEKAIAQEIIDHKNHDIPRICDVLSYEYLEEEIREIIKSGLISIS